MSNQTKLKSEKEKNIPLTFGAIVSLSPAERSDSFIYIDGFVKDRVLLKEYDTHNPKKLFSKFLFQIYPTFINTEKKKGIALSNKNKRFDRPKKGDKTLNTEPNTLEDNEKLNEMNSKMDHGEERDPQMISELQEKIRAEFKSNQETLHKYLGHNVTFNQGVQFLHVLSNKFLAIREESAEIENENFKLGLDEYSSDSTIFRFLPCFKHQKEGDTAIYMNDAVSITCALLSFSKQPFLRISNPVQKFKRREKGTENVGNLTQKKTKIEINGTIESYSKFKLNLYSNYIENSHEDYLTFGDVVWLNHSELLATLVCMTDFQEGIFNHKIEFDFSHSNDQFKQFLGNTNGMWIIENKDLKEGGKIQWRKKIYIRHLRTGLYLKAEEIKDSKGKIKFSLKRDLTLDSEFEFLPIASTITKTAARHRKYISKDTFAWIKHIKTGKIVHGSFDNDQFQKTSEELASSHGIKPTLVDQNLFNEEAAFKVIKANHNEVWETNFLVSSFPILKNFHDSLNEANRKESIDKITMNHLVIKMDAVENCIRDLDSFCNNKLFNTSPDQKFGEKNSFRQKLLKEQFFIDILIEVLREILTKKDFEIYEKSLLNKPETILEVTKTKVLIDFATRALDLSGHENKQFENDIARFVEKKVHIAYMLYKLLTSICRNNYENEIYAFNLIPKFLLHCKYLPSAVDCIISIIQGNDQILHRLGDNIKLDIDRSLGKNVDANIINIVINIKDDEKDPELVDLTGLDPSYLAGNRKSKVSKPVNLINFFLNLLKEGQRIRLNSYYLKLFKCMITKDREAVTINQDLFFQIAVNNPNFMQRALIGLENQKKLQDLDINFPASWSDSKYNKGFKFGKIRLEDCYEKAIPLLDDDRAAFLEAQVELYGDLALGRNYLWKYYIQERLTEVYVFQSIWNPNLSKMIRAALCTIALNVYVDHDPFHPLNIPNMCRIYDDDKMLKTGKAEFDAKYKRREESAHEIQEQVPTLIKNLIHYLDMQDKKFQECLAPDSTQAEQLLEDSLLLNVTQLFSKLIKFDLLRKTGRKNLLTKAVQIFVKILEFDQAFKKLTVAVIDQRENNLQKALAPKKKDWAKFILKTIKNAKNIVNIVNINAKPTAQANQGEAEIFEEPETQHSDPLVKSMLALNYNLERMKFTDSQIKSTLAIKIKSEVCDTLDFLLDLRKDYLISNFIAWSIEFFLDNKVGLERDGVKLGDAKFTKELLKDIFRTLPPISKTGIEEYDIIEDEDDDFEDNALLKGLTKGKLKLNTIIALEKKRVFEDFNKESEDFIHSFDKLLLPAELQNDPDHPEIRSEIFPSLMMTFMNTIDPKLEGKILNLIMRLFNQRTELLESVKKLEMIFDKNEKNTYLFIEGHSLILKCLVEKLEIWLSKPEPPKKLKIETGEEEEEEKVVIENITKEHKAKKDSKESSVERDELEEAIKIIEELTLLLHVNSSVNIEKDACVKTDEDAKTLLSESRQNIMRYLKTYLPVVNLIKEGIPRLQNIIKLTNSHLTRERKQRIGQLFVKADYFLEQFIKENEANQNVMYNYKDVFLNTCYFDLGQINVLCEIFRNNRNLCENIPDYFLTKFIEYIVNEGRQKIFLTLFQVILKPVKIPIIDNQIRVLKNLIDHNDPTFETTCKVLYSIHQKDDFLFQTDDFYIEESSNFADRLKNEEYVDTYRDEPFTYHQILLDILVETISGNESFSLSKSKLKGLFSYGYLLETIAKPDTFIYNENNIINEEVDDKILKSEKTMLIKKNLEISEKNTLKEDKTTAENRKKGFSRIKSSLVNFTYQLYYFSNTKIHEDISPFMRSFINLVEEESKRMDFLSKKFHYNDEFLPYFFGSLLKMLNYYILKFFTETKSLNSSRRDYIALERLFNSIKSALHQFKKKLNEEQLSNLKTYMKFFASEYDSNEMLAPYKKDHEDNENDTSDLVHEQKTEGKNFWQEILSAITSSNPKLEKAIDQEKIILSKAILNFNKYFPKSDEMNIKPENFIKKLIRYLQDGITNKAGKETMISTLQTLIKMMDNNNHEERQKLQNMLDKYDATKMLLNVLSDSSNSTMDLEILNNFIMLGIKMLEGGNERIQKRIYNYCTNYQRSEMFFSKIYSIISNQTNKLRKLGTLGDTTTIIDSLVEEYSTLGPVILENILRLIQLFTEGHYIELQNYLRNQSKSRNSYDILSAIVELLAAYSNQMKKANYESIIRCLDTLAELTQGPCPENQISLMDGKFFEVAHFFLEYNLHKKQTKYKEDENNREKTQYLSKKDKIKEEITQDLDDWMVARIKFKTLIVISSLFELRNDEITVKTVMRSIPIELLKKNLLRVWERYQILYKNKEYLQSSFGHYINNPKTDRKTKNKEDYYNLITESGFLIVFLLERYYEITSYDQDKDILEEIKDKKKKTNEKKKNIIQSSVFGQLGKLTFSIVKSSLDLGLQFTKGLKLGGNKEEEIKRIKEEIQNKSQTREAMKFFYSHSAHIEVMIDKKVERVYFYLLPYCDSLPKEIKTEFNDEVDRQNLQTKLVSLVKKANEYITIMKHEDYLKNGLAKNKIGALFAQNVEVWKSLTFILSLVLNFFIIVSYYNPFDPTIDNFENRMENPSLFQSLGVSATLSLIDVIGIIMIVCSLSVVAFFLIKKAPLVIKKAWEMDPFSKERNPKRGCIKVLLSLLFKLIFPILQLAQTIEIVYYLLYGGLAVVGVVVHPFFFCFHLTEMLLRFPTLNNVIKSFWEPREAFLLSLILFIIMVYIFSLIAYTFIPEQYKGNCDKMIDCFLYTFDYTFKTNGAIGGQLDALIPRTGNYFDIARFFYDNVANILLAVIMVNIFAGIIIDTFGSLREKEYERVKDINDICFICGNDRETFDRQSDLKEGFVEHIRIDHYMWNYIFFVAYLKHKQSVDYTGIESHVSKMIANTDISWFPMHKALALENVEDEEEKQNEEISKITESSNETKKLSSQLAHSFHDLLEIVKVENIHEK